MDDGLKALSTVAIVCVGILVGKWTKDRPTWVRVALGVVAAMFAGGAIGLARPGLQQLMFNYSDDYAWSRARSAIFSKFPVLADVFALDPSMEADFKTALLPLMRQADKTNTTEAVTAATASIYKKRVFPIAARGTDDAINAWGANTVPLLKAIAAISPDACGDYAMTGVNRYSPNPKVDTILTDVNRTLVVAYKTSNPRTNLPTAAEMEPIYAELRKRAQPPFSNADLVALDQLEKQPKSKQCELTTRIFAAVDRLPSTMRAAFYRSIMVE
ncbi:hypothetical protein [uncultured Reyranella sp.]|uniref:hypothetical protein n=1 Tax=uncultured Reyranella sp. TaxID=735512 RepID=UPI0025DFE098|nr:hypothetical protein [uncultured Reyranella sp.]